MLESPSFQVPVVIISVGIACAALNLLVERLAVRIFRRRYQRFPGKSAEVLAPSKLVIDPEEPPSIVLDPDEPCVMPRDEVVIHVSQLQAEPDHLMEERKLEHDSLKVKMLLPDVPSESTQNRTLEGLQICTHGGADEDHGHRGVTEYISPVGTRTVMLEVMDMQDFEKCGTQVCDQRVEPKHYYSDMPAVSSESTSPPHKSESDEQGFSGMTGGGRVAVLRLPQPPAIADDYVSSG